MRTLQQLHEALQNVNAQEVARRSGVIAKTVYRLRGRADYPLAAKSAEAINAVLDELLKEQAKPETAEA